MPEILDTERTVHAPKAPPARSRVVEFSLAILGALCTAAGAYLLWAPEGWLWGDLAEAWHMSAFIAGGVLLMTGLGVYANESYLEDGRWSFRVIAGASIAVLALAGAITAALLLIF